MRRLAFALVLVACAPAGSSSSDAVLADDLANLCGRVAARDVSAWSQPMVRTASLGALTIRVDGGEEAARCELGRLMRRHARRACRGSSPGLVASCSD